MFLISNCVEVYLTLCYFMHNKYSTFLNKHLFIAIIVISLSIKSLLPRVLYRICTILGVTDPISDVLV